MTPGDRYGYLTVLELLTSADAGRTPRDGAWARVRCDCGVRKTVRRRHLQRGLIQSCGCRKATSDGLGVQEGGAAQNGRQA